MMDVDDFVLVAIDDRSVNAPDGRGRSLLDFDRADVDECVRHMTQAGVLASLNLPSRPGRTAARLATDDLGRGLTFVRMYNDWYIDGWCAAHPGRFIPTALAVTWDAVACAAEVRRVAEKGCHALALTGCPYVDNAARFHSRQWDPVWAALSETGTVLCISLAALGAPADLAPGSPAEVLATLQTVNVCSATANLLCSPVLRHFPDIRIALSDGGSGWIGHFLTRIDSMCDAYEGWTHRDFGELPSEVFRRHFLTSFEFEPCVLALRDEIGVGNLCWEPDLATDGPGWRTAPETLGDVFAACDVTDAEIDRITHRNAMQWYSFDPFSNLDRDTCTVGALRTSVAIA